MLLIFIEILKMGLFFNLFKHRIRPNNQHGFSLPEVMIGGALLAGIGLAGAHIYKEQKFAQKRVDNDKELATFHYNLSRKLQSNNNCNATLSGFYGGAVTGNLGTLYSCVANCNNHELEANAFSGANRTPLLSVNSWTDAKELWEVTRIAVDGTYNFTGNIVLRISYRENPKIMKKTAATQAKTVTKQIILTGRFTTAGQFRECTSADESSLTSLQNDLCRDMSAVSTTGVLAAWDPVTQSCVPQGTSASKLKDCGNFQSIRGIRSDGVVHCQGTNDGFNPATVNQTTPPSTCNSSQTAILVYESGEVRIKCQ